MDTSVKKRLKKIGILIGIACLLGGGYAILCMHGIMIPCVFREITGLRCPGCGVTHMSVELMHMHYREAFNANQALFVLLPVFLFFFIKIVARYIRTGSMRLTKAENIICIVLTVGLVGFAVVRNVWGI